MSNQPIDDADLLKFIQKERQRLEHISEAERQALIAGLVATFGEKRGKENEARD